MPKKGYRKDMWRLLRDEVDEVSAMGGNPFYAFMILLMLALGAWHVVVPLAIGLALCFAVSIPLKMFFFVRRPDNQTYKTWVEQTDAASFPSMHAMRTTILAVVLSLFFNNVLMTIFMAGFVVFVGATRIVMKRHRLVDLIGGVVLGLLLSYLSVVISSWLAETL